MQYRLSEIVEEIDAFGHVVRSGIGPDDSCFICARQYQPHDQQGCIASRLKCGHVVGLQCYNHWVATKGSMLCPFCRQDPAAPRPESRFFENVEYFTWLAKSTDYYNAVLPPSDRALDARERLSEGTLPIGGALRLGWAVLLDLFFSMFDLFLWFGQNTAVPYVAGFILRYIMVLIGLNFSIGQFWAFQVVLCFVTVGHLIGHDDEESCPKPAWIPLIASWGLTFCHILGAQAIMGSDIFTLQLAVVCMFCIMFGLYYAALVALSWAQIVLGMLRRKQLHGDLVLHM